MAESRVSQHIVQVANDGDDSNSRVSQHLVQVLMQAPVGIRFQDGDCTKLFSLETLQTETATGLSWAVLNNDDASEVDSILLQDDNLNLTEGKGFIATDITPGTYIVIVQDGAGKIGAYVMDAN